MSEKPRSPGPMGSSARLAEQWGQGGQAGQCTGRRFGAAAGMSPPGRLCNHSSPLRQGTPRAGAEGTALGAERFFGKLLANSPQQRSISLTDLAYGAIPLLDLEGAELRQGLSYDSGWASARADESEVTSLAVFPSIICLGLAIRAWRRKRLEAASIQQDLDKVGRELKCVLNLYRNESARLAKVTAAFEKARSDIADHERALDAAAKAEEELRGTVDRQLAEKERLEELVRLLQEREESLQVQLSKDQIKLDALRVENIELFDEISKARSQAENQEERAQQAELKLLDISNKLAEQIGKNGLLHQEVERALSLVQVKEDEKADLENKLRLLESRIKSAEDSLLYSEEVKKGVDLQTAAFQLQLYSQEAKIKSIETAYKAQTLELNCLRDQLLRASDKHDWSSKMLQLAGSIVRTPQIILRTLSLLSTGNPLIL